MQNYPKISSILLFCCPFYPLVHGATPPYVSGLGSISPLQSELLAAGYLDVTLYDGWVDPNGTTRRVDADPDDGNWHDSTKAIQKALDDAHDYDLAAWFPAGNYKITDTLGAFQYTTTSKPDEQSCTIIGEGPGLVTLTLPANAPKFDNVNNKRAMLVFKHFERNVGSTANMVQLSEKHNGNYPPYDGMNSPPGMSSKVSILFHCEIRNMNFDLGGHDGALGLYMCAAQDTSMENIHVEATGAYGGIWGVPGRNAGAANISVKGGQYGLYLKDFPGNDSMLMPVIAGATLIDQTTAAIIYVDPSPLVLVGFKIEKSSGPAFSINSGSATATGTMSLIDGSIKVNSGTAINNTGGKNIFLQNVYVSGGNTLINNGNGNTLTGSGTWKRIVEYSYTDQRNVGSYSNGTTRFRSYSMIDGVVSRTKEAVGKNVQNNVGEPPDDLVSRHVWTALPDFMGTADGTINVMNAPYNATPNNNSNDAVAIQNAIDAASAAGHGRVFIPSGRFQIDRTIELRHNTVLWGAGRALTTIQWHDSWRPTSGEPAMLRTANDPNATTFLGFMTIEVRTNGGANSGKPYNQAPDAYDRFVALHWRGGRNTMSVAVEIAKEYKQGKEQKTNPHSSLKFDGYGGGRHYFLMTSNKDYADNHPDYRKILINGTQEPLWIYGMNVEHAESDAEVEIRNASNVRIYGTKNEVGGLFNNFTNGWGTIPSILVNDSHNVALYGGGALRHAPSSYPADPGIFVVKGDCTNILFANLIPHKAENVTANNGPGYPMLVEDLSSSAAVQVTWPDAVSLYKRGNLDESVMVHGQAGLPSAAAYFHECEIIPIADSSGENAPIITPGTSGVASNDQFLLYRSNEAGDFVSFDVNFPSIASYEIFVGLSTSPKSGIAQLSIDGASVGAAQDFYHSTYDFEKRYFGDYIPTNTGNKAFRLELMGKHTDSTDYEMRLDYIQYAMKEAEAELLTIAQDSGDSKLIKQDANTSNGEFLGYFPNAVGDFIEFYIGVAAGDYDFFLTIGPTPHGGTYQLSVIDDLNNQTNIGVPQDLYAPTYSFEERNFGSITFTEPGARRIRLEVTGTSNPDNKYDFRFDKLRIAPANTVPVLNPVADETVEEGCSIAVKLIATDIDVGDVLTFSASGLPAFASLIDNGDGTACVLVAPGAGTLGSYTVTIDVDDGNGGLASTTFDIVVDNNVN